ncbi:hypothetical protein PALB_35920 [Pseudoalteromonas luteoviolacea B = ATCC 29581]|nr:hypothetical protein PALB_35920 [Pseudoalteromonas luteoviolacea B = ATCC 29581]
MTTLVILGRASVNSKEGTANAHVMSGSIASKASAVNVESSR